MHGLLPDPPERSYLGIPLRDDMEVLLDDRRGTDLTMPDGRRYLDGGPACPQHEKSVQLFTHRCEGR
ncbi:hypothetical protein GCM10023334_041050 [Nonomuraea thailandensis]